METLSYSQIPSPTPDGFAPTVFANGHSIVGTPNHWEVDNAASVQALYSSYVGNADQLAWTKSNIGGTGKLDQLTAIYLGKFGVGFNYTGTDGIKRTFQIDPTSQFNIDVQANASLGCILNGESWDAASYFIAADNSHMPTPTAQDMRAFSLAVRGYVAQLILRNRALKDQIAAASDMTTLTAIDVTSGWPANP